jgi:cytochrome c biogenesis protein CcmG/thiol:disulfide interchange protein DsbE
MTRMYLWPSIVFVIILAFLWQGLYLKPNVLPSSLIGKQVPKFLLPISDSKSGPVSESILQGQISVLTVWATWCESCVREHQMLNALNKTDDFQLVGINYKDTKYNADLWLNKFGNPYKVNILDTDGHLGIDLGVYGTPTTYIVDRAGIIRYRHVGVLTNDSWNKIILPQINKLIT